MNPTTYLCPQHGGSFTAKCDICGADCEPIEYTIQPPGASATGAQAETPKVDALDNIDWLADVADFFEHGELDHCKCRGDNDACEWHRNMANVKFAREQMAKAKRELTASREECEKLRGVNAKRVVAAIGRICAKCGHDEDGEGRCAECLSGCLDMMRDEFQRIRNLTQDREITGLCDRAMTLITQRVPITAQLDEAMKQLTANASEIERLRADKEIIDYLETLKGYHYGVWCGEDTTYWRDPSVEWSLRKTIRDGTGKMPDELKRMTLRDAVRAALTPKTDL